MTRLVVRVRVRLRGTGLGILGHGAPEGGLRELGVGEAEQLVVTIGEEVEDGLVGVQVGATRVLARGA